MEQALRIKKKTESSTREQINIINILTLEIIRAYKVKLKTTEI